MRTHDFAEIAPELTARVEKMVWCNAATVDGLGRPRSRILHPVWEGRTAWVTTDRASFKSRHLEASPYVSLAYVSDVAKPLYADCHAAWVEDGNTLRHVWDYCRSLPEPMGFDPATIYAPVGETVAGRPAFAVLRLTPYRIVLTQFPEPMVMWTPEG